MLKQTDSRRSLQTRSSLQQPEQATGGRSMTMICHLPVPALPHCIWQLQQAQVYIQKGIYVVVKSSWIIGRSYCFRTSSSGWFYGRQRYCTARYCCPITRVLDATTLLSSQYPYHSILPFPPFSPFYRGAPQQSSYSLLAYWPTSQPACWPARPAATAKGCICLRFASVFRPELFQNLHKIEHVQFYANELKQL